ncbi:unnamed protein product [Cyberlindnera jadinii]|uniref:F-box domain-containing protein n=1 Tax=Cyberlindnera jadinii (strain ATCC 18201 / CBS 1600 / BCRC 20928 / JCM 3617 / NBRC 0987 / NRRL Y-1542) TaxID=983966 RepID=A0A0H5C5P7_CYBJN|nr:unnamed protein product [Cyberlindnera jadinii]
MPKRNSTFEDPQQALKRAYRVLSLTDLPDDILTRIFSYLPQNDVLNLMALSSKLVNPGQMRLYRSLVICEKLNDKFYQSLAECTGRTLISSWPRISSFFENIYTKINKGRVNELKYLEYVEEIASFNVLDSGQLDQYRHLTQSDLNYILKLRQYWDTVVGALPNLKSIVLPKIPLSKLSSLNPSVVNNLRKLSIRLDDGALDPDLKFSELADLTINMWLVDSSPDAPEGHREALAKNLMQIVGHGGTNTKLKSLEVNGAFGLLDKAMEHFDRHFQYDENVSLGGGMKKAYEMGVEYERNRIEFGDNDETNSQYLDDDNDEDENSSGSFQRTAANFPWSGTTLDYQYRVYSTPSAFILETLAKVKFPNLYKFVISNIDTLDDPLILGSKAPFENASFWELLKPSAELGNLTELHIKNCWSGEFSYPSAPSQTIDTSSSSFYPIKSLKKLTFSIPSVSTSFCDRFDQFFINAESPSLEELTIINCSYGVYKTLPRRLFTNLQGFKKLKKFTMHDNSSRIILNQKILNCQIYQSFWSFYDLTAIDDKLFELSLSLREYTNASNRVDDYGQGCARCFQQQYLRFLTEIGDAVFLVFLPQIRTICEAFERDGDIFKIFPQFEQLNLLGFVFDKTDLEYVVKKNRFHQRIRDY